jgi:hypothetical protein
MDHAKQVQFQQQLLHVHLKFAMKLQTHTLLINNAKIIILHVKQMEEDVNHLSIVLIYQIRLLVEQVHHVCGLIHVDQHQQHVPL